MKKDGGKPAKEGELLTMDWIILMTKSDVSKGEGGERVLQLLLDVGTDFLTADPSVKRNGDAAYGPSWHMAIDARSSSAEWMLPKS